MLRKFQLAAIAAAFIAMSGCESLITGGPLLREGEPTGVIVVQNGSNQVVHAVLISDCSASTYGLNRLPDGLTIPPGRSYTFTVSAGCWDVDAGSLGYGEARQRMQVRAGGGVRYTVE